MTNRNGNDKKASLSYSHSRNNRKQPRPSKFSSIYEEFRLKTNDDDDDDDENDNPNSSQPTNPNNNISSSSSSSSTTSNTIKRQGRLYSSKHSLQPSGIRVDDMIYGIKMAHLSCTDDTPDRLKSPAPNTYEALLKVCDNDPNLVKQPLSTILKEKFHLNMDCFIDESGLRYGRPVDTQGFIASNDTTIVLSFRFSTTIYDWITNLSMTSSEWEPDVDEIIGHAGLCSCLDGWITKWCTKRGKPRCHTGFYNNFIYTIPYIRKYILSKLLPDPKDGNTTTNMTPKKVYVCGCSLGAAIATLAYCFILEEMVPYLKDPNYCNHKLLSITAGSPRVGDWQFRTRIMDQLQLLRPLDRAVLCRIVYNQDLVPHVPFHIYGYAHLQKLVYITENGEHVIINPDMKILKFRRFAEIRQVYRSLFQKKHAEAKQAMEDVKDAMEDAVDDIKKRMSIIDKKPEHPERIRRKSEFELECETTPVPIKDHMPYWYLTFLERLKEKEEYIQLNGDDDDNGNDNNETEDQKDATKDEDKAGGTVVAVLGRVESARES